MSDRDAVWRTFVSQYQIHVPEELVENELRYITLEMRHRMQYDALTGGGLHLHPCQELEEQEEELRQAALFEAKSDLVVRDIVARQGFSVTREELEREAEGIAQRQGTTVQMIKDFFGENLAMLERDVKEKKAVDWACLQMEQLSDPADSK